MTCATPSILSISGCTVFSAMYCSSSLVLSPVRMRRMIEPEPIESYLMIEGDSAQSGRNLDILDAMALTSL